MSARCRGYLVATEHYPDQRAAIARKKSAWVTSTLCAWQMSYLMTEINEVDVVIVKGCE